MRSIYVLMNENADLVGGFAENAHEAEERHRADVLTAAGLIEDLNDETGLTYPLPQGAQIEGILRSYDTRNTTRIKVRCSACPQHQHHNRGFRVRLNTGEEVRIGIDCGEKHFGKGAWKAAEADFNKRADHAYNVARVQPTLEAIEQIMPLVHTWHDHAKVFSKWMVKFRKDALNLFNRLATEANQNEGRLLVYTRKREWYVDRHGEHKERSRGDSRLVGNIPYPEMFLGHTPNIGISGAKQELGAAVALLKFRQDPVSLVNAFQHVRRARQFLGDAANIHRSILDNLNPAWLDPMCNWANRDDDLNASYRLEGAAIVHNESGRDESFQFLDATALGVPPIEAINALWPA